MSTRTKPPISVFILTFLALAALCFLLSGCQGFFALQASIPVKRTYSIEGGYGEAQGRFSATFEPAGAATGLKAARPRKGTLYHEGKTIVPLHPPA